MATAYWERDGEAETATAETETTSFWKAGHAPTLIAAFL